MVFFLTRKEMAMVQYSLVMNIIGLFIMAIDKYKAKHHQWRIAEKTIWLVSFIGGAVGTAVGMYLFHHKTRHRAFRYGLPLLAVMEIVAYVWFLTLCRG
jgi:uncharacterized membrane protein YsdA (DUF1294 family)